MIIQIQQTSLFVIALSVACIAIDSRKADCMPYWYVASVIVPFLVSVVTLVVTTFIRIWS